ncbi:hypothetical protein LO771_27375 [Streptacidiphilus sp. ASG 303]|uniref:hypothetical protein n=1 Tax=Streptacidiphilus sp. ASG 303 TaxID=2896847 RepID=UPI001E3C328A|nr:hypothetical protein [Streptacidiphilus sp. ASG 303]MCD0486005.1 hypothetical protein [Streptacidiphilus sp. ASG 303]
MTEYTPAETAGRATPVSVQGRESTEERLRTLESQVQTLAQAVRALAEGLEEIPAQEADRERTARGARRAHELLIAERL